MSKRNGKPCIRLRGVRHNNLKGFDLDLPLNELIVITGLSGSGKSSLAFDTLYAEGQRRYIETFSPYTRQFFDRMDKPQVDSIEGIPPAIAIEQRNSVKTTRSTVGTMTEICEHMKQAWPLVATLFCRQCGQPVTRESPQRIWERVIGDPMNHESEVLITFDVPLTKKLALKESLELIAKQGYQRLLVKGETGFQPVLEKDANGRFCEPMALNETTTNEYRTAVEMSMTGETPVLPCSILRIEEAPGYFGRNTPAGLTVIQDRVRLEKSTRARFVEACEQAYHFGKGHLRLHWVGGRSVDSIEIKRVQKFSKHFHCATCDIEYREPSAAMFSFNHPVGACPTCKGFGRVIQIDYNLAIPDRSLSLNGGVIKPWRSGTGAESQADLAKFCKRRGIPMDVPFRDLPEDIQRWVIEGDEGYGSDKDHQWPKAWYGVKGYFRWLESKAYKMHVRVLLSKYRAYVLCPDCQGNRLQSESLLYRVDLEKNTIQRQPPDVKLENVEQGTGGKSNLTLADFYRLPIRNALEFIKTLIKRHSPKPNEPLGLVLGEVQTRLRYLHEIGLGYLTLDRPTRSLSGGETERVNLTSCLGTRLVNTLYVLDEPSVGLHPRDTARLVGILESLRDAGNTVVVVEHEEGVMRAANQIIDLGPGHGESGGDVVFQGAFKSILKAKGTLTGEYLSGKRSIEIGVSKVGQASCLSLDSSAEATSAIRRSQDRRDAWPTLRISNASKYNLTNVDVEIPLGQLVCVTGVSGSGKSTLVREILVPLLAERLGQSEELAGARDKDADSENDGSEEGESSTAGDAKLTGAENLHRVVLVDQSAIGRTPRSNPAVYIGAFDDIRELFAQTDEAKRRGYNASSFSFNSGQGQCDRCRGAGFEKIEMQFLSDVFIKCPTCDGRRYRDHILEVKLQKSAGGSQKSDARNSASKASRGNRPATTVDGFSIADILEATVDESIEFLGSLEESRHTQKAIAKLRLLQEVGLGYLRLGQPINTLSGGECQRLKLVSHLAGVTTTKASLSGQKATKSAASDDSSRGILFIFDEPTTGLHFEDVRILLLALRRLVEAGHSVLVVEHHLDVIRNSDWIIDLGPGAGDEGGQVVATGRPDDIAAVRESFTGQALRDRAKR